MPLVPHLNGLHAETILFKQLTGNYGTWVKTSQVHLAVLLSSTSLDSLSQFFAKNIESLICCITWIAKQFIAWRQENDFLLTYPSDVLTFFKDLLRSCFHDSQSTGRKHHDPETCHSWILETKQKSTTHEKWMFLLLFWSIQPHCIVPSKVNLQVKLKNHS